MAKIVFILIGVIWGGVGLYLVLFPTLCRSSMTGRLQNPGFRFVAMQGIIFAGLVLVMGTAGFHGFGLWVLVGSLGITLASIVLGCSTHTRDKVAWSVERWPLWLYQVGGMMMLSLAVLFGADLILSGA